MIQNDLETATSLCEKWWHIAESLGWYIALTGSVLYAGSSSNDIDFILYRKEGHPTPPTPPKETMKALGIAWPEHVSDEDYETGEESPSDSTWCNYYGKYQGAKINCFFMRFLSETELNKTQP